MTATLLVPRPRWMNLGDGTLLVQCACCGSLITLAPHSYAVTADGLVTPYQRCTRVGCGIEGQLLLELWGKSAPGSVEYPGALARAVSQADGHAGQEEKPCA